MATNLNQPVPSPNGLPMLQNGNTVFLLMIPPGNVLPQLQMASNANGQTDINALLTQINNSNTAATATAVTAAVEGTTTTETAATTTGTPRRRGPYRKTKAAAAAALSSSALSQVVESPSTAKSVLAVSDRLDAAAATTTKTTTTTNASDNATKKSPTKAGVAAATAAIDLSSNDGTAPATEDAFVVANDGADDDDDSSTTDGSEEPVETAIVTNDTSGNDPCPLSGEEFTTYLVENAEELCRKDWRSCTMDDWKAWLPSPLMDELERHKPTEEDRIENRKSSDPNAYAFNVDALRESAAKIFVRRRKFCSKRQLSSMVCVFAQSWGFSTYCNANHIKCCYGKPDRPRATTESKTVPPERQRRRTKSPKELIQCPFIVKFSLLRRFVAQNTPPELHPVWITVTNLQHTCQPSFKTQHMAMIRGGRLQPKMDKLQAVMSLLCEGELTMTQMRVLLQPLVAEGTKLTDQFIRNFKGRARLYHTKQLLQQSKAKAGEDAGEVQDDDSEEEHDHDDDNGNDDDNDLNKKPKARRRKPKPPPAPLPRLSADAIHALETGKPLSKREMDQYQRCQQRQAQQVRQQKLVAAAGPVPEHDVDHDKDDGNVMADGVTADTVDILDRSDDEFATTHSQHSPSHSHGRDPNDFDENDDDDEEYTSSEQAHRRRQRHSVHRKESTSVIDYFQDPAQQDEHEDPAQDQEINDATWESLYTDFVQAVRQSAIPVQHHARACMQAVVDWMRTTQRMRRMMGRKIPLLQKQRHRHDPLQQHNNNINNNTTTAVHDDEGVHTAEPNHHEERDHEEPSTGAVFETTEQQEQQRQHQQQHWNSHPPAASVAAAEGGSSEHDQHEKSTTPSSRKRGRSAASKDRTGMKRVRQPNHTSTLPFAATTTATAPAATTTTTPYPRFSEQELLHMSQQQQHQHHFPQNQAQAYPGGYWGGAGIW